MREQGLSPKVQDKRSDSTWRPKVIREVRLDALLTSEMISIPRKNLRPPPDSVAPELLQLLTPEF